MAFSLRIPILRLDHRLQLLGLWVFRCGPHHWLSLRVCVVLSGATELCLLSLFLLGAGLAIVEPLTGVAFVPLPAAPAVFRGVSCRRLLLGGYATFLAPVACPAPAVELCLLGLRYLWCVAWISTLCRALPPGPAVCAAYPAAGCPWGVSAFSDTVCLTYCCAGGVGWAATFPLCF